MQYVSMWYRHFSNYVCSSTYVHWLQNEFFQIWAPIILNACLKYILKCILKITILLLPLLTKLGERGVWFRYVVSKSLKPVQGSRSPSAVTNTLGCGTDHSPAPRPARVSASKAKSKGKAVQEKAYKPWQIHTQMPWSLPELQTGIKNRHNFPLTFASLHQAACPGKAALALPRLWSFPRHVHGVS